jgi:hypothetical protein
MGYTPRVPDTTDLDLLLDAKYDWDRRFYRETGKHPGVLLNPDLRPCGTAECPRVATQYQNFHHGLCTPCFTRVLNGRPQVPKKIDLYI